jgi:hypothetical protein
VSDRDRHPTERLQLTELHQLGTWPVAMAALDALHPELILLLRRGVLREIRKLTRAMSKPSYQPELVDRLDWLGRALRHLGHAPTWGVPVTDPEPPPPAP